MASMKLTHAEIAEEMQRPGLIIPVPEVPTLRDYFAMAALAGMCAADSAFERTADELAHWSYQQADEMLAERKNQGGAQ